ncbi:MAG TPA: type II secretion system F family protein [Alphaproteobacteria bacterium]|nr:type II secretion system F family protein [Alphaproteobacteria bacterium]
MAVSSTIVLSGLTAGAFVVAGAAFTAYNIMEWRNNVTRKVDALRPLRPGAAEVRKIAARPVRLGGAGIPAREEREIIRRMARFGVSAERAVTAYTMFRFAVGLACLIAMAIISSRVGAQFFGLRMLGFAFFGFGIGFFIPSYVVKALVSRRTEAIEMGLADALELLVVSVEAGLALEDALDRVVVEMRRSQPILAEELAITSADLKILPSRDQALLNLADRVDIPSVRSVVSTLSQTMRYGTPLAQSMRVVASELRNDMLLKLEERANKMPVMLTVPMIVFIMPCVFLIIGGPAFLHLMDIFFK